MSTQPVFIVGSPRSGTTWLYHILLSSGDFAIYRSEAQIYNNFGPSFNDFAKASDREAFLQAWLPSEYFARTGLEPDAFSQAVRSGVSTPGDLLLRLMQSICAYQGAARWAECTPDNALYVGRIKREIPNALFIHLVRDGRDVALSLARQRFISQLPWDKHPPETAAAAYWAWIVGKAASAGRRLSADMLTVHYEDLVSSPADELQRIGRFIGKPLNYEHVQSSPIGAVDKPNTSFDSDKSATRTEPRWKTLLDADLLRVIECLQVRELREFGYTVQNANTRSLPAIGLRTSYFARFEAGLTAKRFGLGSRSSIEVAASDDNDQQDVTLRPGRHIEAIRELVTNKS